MPTLLLYYDIPKYFYDFDSFDIEADIEVYKDNFFH